MDHREGERIDHARARLASLVAPISEGEPWPLADAFGTEPEASWGPREVLAHLAEMLPFWLGELERVVDGGTGVPFGRVAEDGVRIGLIERDRSLPLRALSGRIDRGLDEWAERLASLGDDERRAVGRHSRLGELSAEQLAERFVIGHVEDHIAQLEAILADRSN
ncbi:MAG: DinB family protein [Candidatus Limnocylindrales bacterium]